jgi:hypothetical protein
MHTIMKSDELEARVQKVLSFMWDVSLFYYALLFVCSFLVSVLVLYILGIWIYFAFAISVVVVATYFFLWTRGNNALKEMIRGNPRLRDRLEAAYDNRDRENIITRDLIRDVNFELSNIRTDVFVDVKKAGAYITISIIAVFLLISLLFLGFEGFGLPGLFAGSGGGGSGGTEGEGSGTGAGGGGTSGTGDVESSQDTSMGQGSSDDIYGDSSIASIDGEERELEMHPEYGEHGDFDFDGSEGGENVDEIKDGYVQATAAESYTENIPIELEETVRKYFEKLTEN